MSSPLEGKHLLFLCVANAARSAMAEGLAPRVLGPSVRVSSAGAHPASAPHPYAVEVMREIGLDISGHVPRPAVDVERDAIDAVITLCSEDVRPEHLRAIPWVDAPVPDPALHAMEFSRAMAIETFRAAREDVEEILLRLRDRGLPT